jgi:hypothetical protein
MKTKWFAPFIILALLLMGLGSALASDLPNSVEWSGQGSDSFH